MVNHTSVMSWALITCLTTSSACLGVEVEAEAEADAIELADVSAQALTDNGTRETLVTGIQAAENALFTSTGRLFVTGDSGIYEIVRGTGNTWSAQQLQVGGKYKFGGMAEVGTRLYVNAYDDSFRSTLFAAELTAKPVFKAIYAFRQSGIANGAAADSSGRLYVANTLSGIIQRLEVDPNDPFKIKSESTWLSTSLPNGLRVSEGYVYFSAGTSISRAQILADGKAGAIKTLVNELTYFDDFYVDNRGIVAANYLLGTIAGYSPTGAPQRNSALGTFDQPSSVALANGRLGFGANDAIVTEKGVGRVSVYHAGF